jgi:diguanylate cyclase (GGDEF)-like protein
VLDLTSQDGGRVVRIGPDASLLDLPGLLARSSSGIGFIYATLERLAARYGLRDALVVVDGPNDRRQAFRLGRGGVGVDPGSPLPSPLDAEPGLYLDPPAIDDASAEYVTSLVDVALRLDTARHDASRDALTGLFNRRSYREALEQAAARAQRYGWQFALVLLDIDRFKAINDRWGHAHGDEALRAFGADLRSCLRSGDVAARVGGDEFALLVLAASGRPAVDSLLERLRTVNGASAGRLGLRFSAGVAYFPDDAVDTEGLARVADQRLYAGKSAGGA